MTPKNSNMYMFCIMIYQIFLSLTLPFALAFLRIELSFPVLIVLTQLFCFILPFCIYLAITKQKITDVLFIRKISFKNILLIILIVIALQPLTYFLSALSSLFFNNDVSDMFAIMNDYPFIVTFAIIAITPSICEEITLRGVVLSGYKNTPVLTGALINGLFFGILHLNAQQFLYAFLLGTIFYYFVYYTKSIFASAIAHFCINGSQAILASLSLFFTKDLDPELLAISPSFTDTLVTVGVTGIFAAFTAPIAFSLLYYFVNENKKQDNCYVPPEGFVKYGIKNIFDVYFWLIIGLFAAFMLLTALVLRTI